MTPDALKALAARMRDGQTVPTMEERAQAAALLEQIGGADAGFRAKLLNAICYCPHGIDTDRVQLYRDPKQGDGNALHQLANRIEVAHLAALAHSGELGEIRELFCLDDDQSVKDFVVHLSDQGPTVDYLKGHQDGCKWAADLAEANDPRTSDWLYDDPHELAKAIRKGPEMPPATPSDTERGLYEALRNIVKSLADQDDEGMIEHAQQIIDARAAIAAYEAKRGGVR